MGRRGRPLTSGLHPQKEAANYASGLPAARFHLDELAVLHAFSRTREFLDTIGDPPPVLAN